MSNSQFIFKCNNCEQMFCGNCTDATEFTLFCSVKCEEEKEKELENGR